MRAWQIFAAVPVLASVLVLSGCGDGSEAVPAADVSAEQGSAAGAARSDGATVPEAMRAFRADGDVAELAIEGTDRMQFSKDRLTVRAGQMVRLTLQHTGNLPAQSMGHNVVILKPGDDPFEFSTSVNEQGGSLDNQYVPEPLRDRVVAFTDIIGGGESTAVEFRAPEEPGEYPFLCSFPGHVGMMSGVLVVEG